MMAKGSEKREAIRLRLQGRSLSDIAIVLGISKATASVWLRHVPLSKRARQAIQAKRQMARLKSAETHRTQTRARLEESASFATKMVASIHWDKSMSSIACALIYLNNTHLNFTHNSI